MADSFINRISGLAGMPAGSAGQLMIARVTKVIYGQFLDDGKTLDPDYKGITSIGSIRYVLINSAQFDTNTGNSNKPARPAFSFIHQYPVQDEYVYIIPGPGLNFNETAGDMDYYYLPPFGLWRAPNHNAAPNIAEYAAYFNYKDTDYEESFQGLQSGPNDDSISYPLGNDFIELENVKSVRPFVGDTTIEGRWGQSIRMGSSLKKNKGTNTWSDSKKDGDPIIIIRNGQGEQDNTVGFEMTVENINVDQSSIYLTAGQSINIDDLKNFPLTSWNVSINATNNTVVAELTTPIIPLETLSPETEDYDLFLNSNAPQ